MAWKNISGYLEKFFTITPPWKFYQKDVVKALNEVLKIELLENDVEYRFGIVYIRSSVQILKNEIFLNKEKIIKQLNQKIKRDIIKDIRF